MQHPVNPVSSNPLFRISVLPGLHPVRIEFFWRPPEGVSVTVQRPPGIKAFSPVGVDGGIEVPMGLMIDGIVLKNIKHLGIWLEKPWDCFN